MRGELSRTSAHAPLLHPALPGTHLTPPHRNASQGSRSFPFYFSLSLSRALPVAVSRPRLSWVAVITASPSRLPALPWSPATPQLILPLILAPACVSSCSSSSFFFFFLFLRFGFYFWDLDFAPLFLESVFVWRFFFSFFFGVWKFLRRKGLL